MRPLIALVLLSLPAAAGGGGQRNKLFTLAGEAAKEHKVPECLAYVIVVGESRGNPEVVGHDEDYRGPNNVPARSQFLAGGKKYSGATFAPAACKGSRATCNKAETRNDDGAASNRKHIDTSKRDLGIDWRYSHGFGLGQITFGGRAGPYCRGTKTYGTNVAGKCFTVQQLLTPEGGVRALVARLGAWHKHAKKHCAANGLDGEENVARYTFAAYGAGGRFGDTQRKSVNRRVEQYMDCAKNGSGALQARLGGGGSKGTQAAQE